MGERVIETKAIISAEDKTGSAFASAIQHMKKLDEAVERNQAHMKQTLEAERAANAASRAQAAADRQIDREDRQRLAMAKQRLHEEEKARRMEIAHLREVNRLQMEIEHHGVRRFMAQSAATAVAAHSVAEGIGEAMKAGAERQHVRTGMANAGMGPDEIKRSEEASIAASKDAPNMSVSEIMELHKEARSAVQHPEEAFNLLPQLAKAASVLKGMGSTNANIADIVKAGESLGLMNDPKRFEKFLDSQVRAMNVMGKTITTEQIYEAAKYSKSAGSTLSDDFINLVLPSLIQEMHGSSAGDALSMLSKTLRGGLQHKHLPVEKLNELGMLEDPSKIRRSKTGQIMGYSGKVVGDEMLSQHPDQWAHMFNEHMEAHGIKSYDDKVKTLYETLPSTAANLIRILIQQEETLKQHRANYLAAPGLDETAQNQLQDASVAVGNLAHSFNDLGAAVTGPAMATIGKTLSSIAGGVRALAEAAHDHPIAAMTGGAVAGGLALGASGYMAYKLSTGFGLTTSAKALDASAAELSGAAAKLGAAGALSHGPGGIPDPGGKSPGYLDNTGRGLFLGWQLWNAIGDIPPLVPIKDYKPDGKSTLSQKIDEWGAKNLPWFLGGGSGAGAGLPAPKLSGQWQDGRFSPNPSGYTRDFTLGGGPGFTKGPGQLVPPSGFAYMSDYGLKHLADTPAGHAMTVSFDQPPPLKIEVSVNPSSALLEAVQSAKAASVQLKAQAKPDTGPGGLGETHTGQ